MDPETLQQRIARGEDLHTEFKEWPIHADSLAAALEMAPAKSRERTLLEAAVAWGRGRSAETVAFQPTLLEKGK